MTRPRNILNKLVLAALICWLLGLIVQPTTMRDKLSCPALPLARTGSHALVWCRDCDGKNVPAHCLPGLPKNLLGPAAPVLVWENKGSRLWNLVS
jgi:hypothetical protein